MKISNKKSLLDFVQKVLNQTQQTQVKGGDTIITDELIIGRG